MDTNVTPPNAPLPEETTPDVTTSEETTPDVTTAEEATSDVAMLEKTTSDETASDVTAPEESSPDIPPSYVTPPGITPSDITTPGATPPGGTLQKSKKSLIKMICIIGIPVIIAGITAFYAYNYYNSDEQRFIREINLGIKALGEMDYETAKASFNGAIEIDDTDLEAYMGLMIAYSGLDDKEGMKDTYERALEVITRDIDTYTEENKTLALRILEYVQELYGDDVDQEIEKTEAAYELFPDNEEFKDILIDDYFKKGCELVDSREYEEGIEYLEKALELDPDNEIIKERRDRAVKDYIAYAFDNGDYDLVMELVNKYKGIVDGIDDEFIQNEINEINRIKEEEKQNQAYMKIVYDTMATEDYSLMLDMYNSDDCKDFLQRMTREVYYYFPDNNESKSGTGAACYYVGGNYYFYYGNYENGSREGYGTSFIGEGGDMYLYFKGNWSGDDPNGEGEEIRRDKFENSGEEFNGTKKGVLKDGYWEGHVEEIIKSDGYSYDNSYDSADGIPTKDRTAEWERDSGYSESDIPYGNYIYAYDIKDLGWGGWTGVWGYEEYGEKIGTIGY